MPSSPRRSGSRQSRSRSASNRSGHSSRTSSYRTATQHASDNGRRSSSRNSSAHQHSPWPPPPVSPRPRSPSPSLSRAPNQKRFGLNVPTNLPRVPGRFDFEDKYPEDPIYEEMGPNARLWRAFLDECEVFDMDMVTESRDGLDLLLVFAGLFSAVLTTFVAQTSQALSTNFPAVSSSLLVEMVQLQRAQINNTPIEDILPADTAAGPSGFDVWVNALWFTSLTLSLGTALMAVLVKQWLYQYMSMISGTARDRSLIRYYRFEGLQKWHVLTIIGTLPIVLHIALGLFLAGLVVFLVPLNIPLACIIGFITLIVYTLYAVSNILPIIYTQCPYRTPFSDILNVMLRAVSTFPSLVVMRVRKLSLLFGDIANTVTTADHVFKTLKDAERIAATDDGVAEEVAWRALLWLYEMTSNPPTKRIIQESLGCLPDDVSKRPKELQADLEQTLGELSPTAFDYEKKVWYRSILSGQERRAERILRAVRDPLAPKEGLIVPATVAPWRIDVTDTKLSFHILTSILAHAPSLVVGIDSVSWDLPSLLRYYLLEPPYIDSPPHIHLPPRLWTHLIASIFSNLNAYDSDFVASLCDLAVTYFDDITQWTVSPSFAAPVTITHRTVMGPLFHIVVDLLVRHLGIPYATDCFEYTPLTQLFTIYDYAVSQSNLNFDASRGHPAVLINSWAAIGRLADICDNDKPILCRRAENVILQMTMDADWWDGRDDGRRCLFYHNVLGTYLRSRLSDWHSNGSEIFRKLLSDNSLSLTRDSPALFYRISKALQDMLNQPANAPVYSLLFCSAPFLSTRNLSSYANCIDFLYPVVSAFVEATGKVPRDIVLQSLFAEPERFYTICWILTLGGASNHYDDWEEHRRAIFLLLALIDPTHVLWESRARYMSMDPRDWPYLRLLDEELEDEELVAIVRRKMNVCLGILDDFFASLNISPPDNLTYPDAPPPNNTAPQIISSDNLNPRTVNPHWRHIRQLVSGTRAFLGLSSVSHSSPSDPENAMELGLRLGSSRAESVESHPPAAPDVYVLRSTARQSSRSSDTNTACSFHSLSSSNVPNPDHQSLSAPPSEAPMTLPQNAELRTVSAPPLETSSSLSDKTEDATEVD